MNRNLIAASLALCCLSCFAVASPITWQEYAGPSAGARAVGLSGCMAGVNNDPSVMLWNPASLFTVRWPMIVINYTHSSGLLSDPLFSGPKRINYLAFCSQGVGLSWRSLSRYSAEKMMLEVSDSLSRYLRYGADEFCLTISRSDEMRPNTGMGITFKGLWGRLLEIDQIKVDSLWQKARATDENGVGYGLDLGFYGNLNRLKLSLACQNLIGRMYWSTAGDDKLKPKLLAGAALSPDRLPVVSVAVEKFMGQGTPQFRYSGAAEYKYVMPQYGAITGRMGYSKLYKSVREDYIWSGGIGYLYKKLIVDGAVVNTLDLTTGKWQQSYVGSVSFFME
jgi:hypothetical protein